MSLCGRVFCKHSLHLPAPSPQDRNGSQGKQAQHCLGYSTESIHGIQKEFWAWWEKLNLIITFPFEKLLFKGAYLQSALAVIDLQKLKRGEMQVLTARTYQLEWLGGVRLSGEGTKNATFKVSFKDQTAKDLTMQCDDGVRLMGMVSSFDLSESLEGLSATGSQMHTGREWGPCVSAFR